nr:purine-uracil permease NCS1 [Ipomoea batatas]
MASLWVGLVVGVPSFYLAGSLVELGMSWWQGVATVVAANIITLITLILAGHPGTRDGIPFPVVARAAFGVSGAHIPTLLRALVACGWYGIETWIGGQAIFILLPKTIKGSSFSQPVSWLGTSVIEFTCFIVFWVVQLASVFFGINGIRKMENYSAPILVALVVWLSIWAYVKADALINLCPSRFTFRRGAVVTALLGIGFQPWRLMQSSESFLNTWLVGYSVFVGPVGGIILADYYLVKGMDLRVKDLYSRSPYGAYYYCGGYNLVAIMALVIGVLPGIPGFLQSVGILKSIPSFFTAIYDIAWFFGLFAAGAFYWFLSFLEEKCINHQPLDPLLPNSS